MPGKSKDSKSSGSRASPRSVLGDRKQDRFAAPASVNYTRYGRPFVGLADEPSIEVRRYAVEQKWAGAAPKVSRRLHVEPKGRNEVAARQDMSQSRRYAARGQFEANVMARRQSEDVTSKFLAQRAACIQMDQVKRKESNLLSKYPHGATKRMAHKHCATHNSELPGLGLDQKIQDHGRS